MRFSVAWADTLAQNTLLKWFLVLLSGLCIVLATGLIIVSQRDPLIIERSCLSKLLSTGELPQTTGEVKAFVAEALGQRFNSADAGSSFIATEERTKAQKERDDLNSKKIRQTVLINSISIEKDRITVDSDRIIAVDEVRTVFRFPLDVKIATTARSERNPYGLVLLSATQIQEDHK